MSDKPLAQAWSVNHGVTMDLLRALDEEALEARYSPRTRTARSQFQHLQYVRVRNLEKRGAAFQGSVRDFPKGAEPTKRELVRGLEASGRALEALMAHCDETGKVKSWGGRPPANYLAYFVAHEAHHRALILVCLRFAGVRLSSDIKMGALWGPWGKARK